MLFCSYLPKYVFLILFNCSREAYDLPGRGEFILSSALFHDTLGRDVLFSSLANGAAVVTLADKAEALAQCIRAYKV